MSEHPIHRKELVQWSGAGALTHFDRVSQAVDLAISSGATRMELVIGATEKAPQFSLIIDWPAPQETPHE